MKLNEKNVAVLKNFAQINSAIVFQEGKTQRAISHRETIFASYDFEEEFPFEFGIYDLSQFLNNISILGENPRLNFVNDKQVMIEDDNLSIAYGGCHPSLIKKAPNKELVLDDWDAECDLKYETIQKLQRVASINQLDRLTIDSKDGILIAKVHEAANSTSNYGQIPLGEHSGNNVLASFLVSNFKVLPVDYTFRVKAGQFATLSNKEHGIRYAICMEA